MSKSGAYLVSSKPIGDNSQVMSHDNPGFTTTGEKVAYSPENGVNLDNLEPKPRPLRPYRGMGKEDLLYFSSQPFWSRLRMICIAIIFIGWFALIITVVALVLVYPKCRDPPGREWWQTKSVYRVYVPSFKDSNDDGIGDLKGLESKLDYIKGLGFGILSLSPFYKTPDTDAPPNPSNFRTGNDMAITDHTAVGAVYGTMADFESLVEAANNKDMNVVVDFIPNLTSDKHPWFLASQNLTANEKKNFYVWQSTSTPPNNWRSVYGGSAWTRSGSGTRNESYLHQFRPDTPDLNLRSAQVQDELEGIMKFWLDKGVSGFNVRDASYLYEDYDLRDEPVLTAGTTDYADLDHIYTTNQPEVYSILTRWREFLNDYNGTGQALVLMTGIEGGLDVMSLYGGCSQTGIQVPLNTRLAAINGSCDGTCVADYIDSWYNAMPSGRWPNWVTGNEDTSRMADRFGPEFTNAFTILSTLMPGTPVTYYGDELGLKSELPDTNDAWIRDRSMRPIMLWSNSSDGGFCNGTCTPWTSKIGNPSDGNVETGTTLMSLLTELSELRSEPSFRFGDYAVALRDSAIVSFVREFDGETGYLVAVNFSPNEETRDFSGSHDTIQTDVSVAFVFGGSYEKEDDADSTSLKIPPYGGVVVSWDYVAEEL